MAELNYLREGEYLTPDLELKESGGSYGKYGMLRKTYLKEHRPGTYTTLLTEGKLTAHLSELDKAAREQVARTVESRKAEAGVTEDLKAGDPMEWVGRMNALKEQAEEIVLRELIYN